jgi:hypothetical protein
MKWITPIVFLIGSSFVIAFCAASEPYPCSSCFIGELKLINNPDDPRTKILDADLKFIDRNYTAWLAGKGDVTDGASIPELFQPIIGGRWEADYLPAAVMHDHYANIKHLVRTWWDTDRMFYQAMLVRDVGLIKALVMYYGVYVFGPHWDELQPGEPCGPNCTYISKNKMTIAYQAADYNLSHKPELEEVRQRITNAALEGAPLTLRDLESLADKKHRDNPFLRTRKRNR